MKTASLEAAERSGPPGARYLGARRCLFETWAPKAKTVEVHLVAPFEKTIPMEKGAGGLWRVVAESVEPGSRYYLRVDGSDYADPATRFQPEGTAGPSEVVDEQFAWSDSGWTGIALEEMVLYELHVGTFTPEGTFDAAIARLGALKDLGVNAVELLPVAQFPGHRNWGYDGVFFYAAQNTYGGPAGLKRFVDACHRHGMACVLDVVYNHVGPEGQTFYAFGPYFSDRYRTPWGPVLNYDGPGSDQVRRYFIENAVYWLEEFHMDALRLDAVSAIVDNSAQPFLGKLSDAVRAFAKRSGRLIYTMGETSKNDPRYVSPVSSGGYGLDSQWNFDFHHALHALLTGEDAGYLGDHGKIEHLARAYQDGFVYTGQYSPYWGRSHGAPADNVPSRRLIVYGQNHDESGNRPDGARWGTLLPFEGQKLAAAAVLLAPSVPMLFMGEEYGETRPFFYFTDHANKDLQRMVREGRREEMKGFGWKGEPSAEPDTAEAFERSILDWEKRSRGKGGILSGLYRKLIQLRKETAALARLDKKALTAEVLSEKSLLLVRREEKGGHAAIFLNCGPEAAAVSAKLPDGKWRRILDTAEPRWDGPGTTTPADISSDGRPARFTLPGHCAVLYERAK